MDLYGRLLSLAGWTQTPGLLHRWCCASLCTRRFSKQKYFGYSTETLFCVILKGWAKCVYFTTPGSRIVRTSPLRYAICSALGLPCSFLATHCVPAVHVFYNEINDRWEVCRVLNRCYCKMVHLPWPCLEILKHEHLDYLETC